MAIGLCSALKMNQWLGSGAAQPMAGKPAKVRQNGRGIWLYNGGIRQSSSGYFDWSDDLVVQPYSTAKCAVLVSEGTEVTLVTEYVPYWYYTSYCVLFKMPGEPV